MLDGAVLRRNFHGSVHPRSCSSADQEWNPEPIPLHLAGHENHFVKRRRNQAAQAQHVWLVLFDGRENVLARDHHAQIVHLEVVTTQHNCDDVLSDVVNVAFHRRYHHSACVLGIIALILGIRDFAAEQRLLPLLFFHERQQISNSFFHYTRGFNNLRQKHFPGSEKVSHNIHSFHERALDHVQWLLAFQTLLFGVGDNVLVDSFDQRISQPFGDSIVAPGFGAFLDSSSLFPFFQKFPFDLCPFQ
mmetsp:Transcript_2949/g.4452  ORF Transcript_2949/g.4452 Transcript_2949/m.4452 type:complete len:246 (+) Transcript_2949:1144-1881(+)